MTTETGQNIQLKGKNGESYSGKIYTEKNASSAIAGNAIVCLTNSHFTNNQWHHKVNSIFNTDDVPGVLTHFGERDDISHMVLIPYQAIENRQADHVDNLIRQYLHS